MWVIALIQRDLRSAAIPTLSLKVYVSKTPSFASAGDSV